jgi:hypothetical protein
MLDTPQGAFVVFTHSVVIVVAVRSHGRRRDGLGAPHGLLHAALMKKEEGVDKTRIRYSTIRYSTSTNGVAGGSSRRADWGEQELRALKQYQLTFTSSERARCSEAAWAVGDEMVVALVSANGWI